MEVHILRGMAINAPDDIYGRIMKGVHSAISSARLHQATVVICDDYVVKDRCSQPKPILVDPWTTEDVIIIEQGQRVSVSGSRRLYLPYSVAQEVQMQLYTMLTGAYDANKLYDNLCEVIKPYIWDTCGYSQESTSFDIVLAVKEIISNLDRGLTETSTQLKNVRAELEGIRNASIYSPMYNKEEFKQELAKKTLDGKVTDQLAATTLWCAISSALIRKYMTLTEEDHSKALNELIRLANELDKADFLHKADIEEVL